MGNCRGLCASDSIDALDCFIGDTLLEEGFHDLDSWIAVRPSGEKFAAISLGVRIDKEETREGGAVPIRVFEINHDAHRNNSGGLKIEKVMGSVGLSAR